MLEIGGGLKVEIGGGLKVEGIGRRADGRDR